MNCIGKTFNDGHAEFLFKSIGYVRYVEYVLPHLFENARKYSIYHHT